MNLPDHGWPRRPPYLPTIAVAREVNEICGRRCCARSQVSDAVRVAVRRTSLQLVSVSCSTTSHAHRRVARSNALLVRSPMAHGRHALLAAAACQPPLDATCDLKAVALIAHPSLGSASAAMHTRHRSLCHRSHRSRPCPPFRRRCVLSICFPTRPAPRQPHTSKWCR